MRLILPLIESLAYMHNANNANMIFKEIINQGTQNDATCKTIDVPRHAHAMMQSSMPGHHFSLADKRPDGVESEDALYS